MKTIFSNAENSRVLVFSPFLFFNLSLPLYPSYFALLSAIIDAAAHWYPGFLYQHQPWRLHWLCKVSIWKICYKDTARHFCLFAWGFSIMFRTHALKCDSEDPGCRVLQTCRTMLFLNSHNVERVPVAGESSPSSQAWFHWSWSLSLGLKSHVLQDHRNGYWWSFHIVINAYFGSCDSVWYSFAQNNGCHWILSVPAVWLQRIIVAECPAGPGLTFSSLNWKGCENVFQNVLPWFPGICASGTSYQHFDTSKNIEDVFTLWRINVSLDIFMPYLP